MHPVNHVSQLRAHFYTLAITKAGALSNRSFAIHPYVRLSVRLSEATSSKMASQGYGYYRTLTGSPCWKSVNVAVMVT